ncbi:hypothetical protein [Pseudooceanicola sp.]|uniref:hypothetical protein n=1 Tax=Pseudooceanicola sp. TaxID=1914328 RepID=UPI0026295491|nr:hypothetical protein [Pseudooceanicola sp.]
MPMRRWPRGACPESLRVRRRSLASASRRSARDASTLPSVVTRIDLVVGSTAAPRAPPPDR